MANNTNPIKIPFYIFLLLFKTLTFSAEGVLGPECLSIFTAEDSAPSCYHVHPEALTHFDETLIPDSFRLVPHLQFSGGNQFNFEQLQTLLAKRIPYKESGYEKVLLVDLRGEPHWMFSCHGTAALEGRHAMCYQGMPPSFVQNIEDRFVQNYEGFYTEETAALVAGAAYCRFAITDETRPHDQEVERFLELASRLQDGKYWPHFHCLAGQGRTTTLMAMYEIFLTKDPSLLEILKNQHGLGGFNLARTWKVPAYKKRLKFLQNFCDYMNDSVNGFPTVSWSAWVARTPQERFQERPVIASWWSPTSLFASFKAGCMLTYMGVSRWCRNCLKKAPPMEELEETNLLQEQEEGLDLTKEEKVAAANTEFKGKDEEMVILAL